MKTNSKKIQINKPVEEVFSYILDPDNKTDWRNSLLSEKANNDPKLGTVYKDKPSGEAWDTYTITRFKENEEFVKQSSDRIYQQRVQFRAIDSERTEVTFDESVTSGNIHRPISRATLQRLKTAMEGLGSVI